jgi:acetoin utilization deacetylase AcuC-like enzyme
MPKFATYLHPQTCLTSKPSHLIPFKGYSLPHYSKVRQELEKSLSEYPSLPVRRVKYSEYLRVHTREYLQQLVLLAAEKPLEQFNLEMPHLLGGCWGLEHCLPGYAYGLGGLFEAIAQMKQGNLERAYCFSLVGHHAHANWGHGYCLLNPLAAAAKYAQEQGFEKILIVDWDIHHGDGTQSIFSGDRSIYCLSIHSAIDLYMAKASDLKRGTTTAAEAVGHCNIPLLPARFADDFPPKMGLTGQFYRANESLSAFQAALEQIPWTPDLILIFSGYDSHRDDCGKETTGWTGADFAALTVAVLEVAKKANCPVLSNHGGGYKLPITIASAVSHVKTLASYG